jgi:nitrite reductase/ring-hydroxylating ferredoxin subunit
MENDRECPLHAKCTEAGLTRRGWLRSASGFGAGVVLLGLGLTDADALPIVFAEGTQAGAERRYPIPSADSVTIDRPAQLIVVRAAGHLYVFALSCPHQNNAVKWVAKDNQFQCTKHDSHYQVDGLHTSGRATRNMDRYVIRRDGDSVVVDLHKWVQSDKDPAGWAAAAIAL